MRRCYTHLKEFAKDDTLKTVSKQEGNGKGRVKFLSYVRIYTFCITVKWLEQSNTFTNTWLSSAQSSSIEKFPLGIWDKIGSFGKIQNVGGLDPRTFWSKI